MFWNEFQLEQAEKLLLKGFDGSNANKSSIKKAVNLLTKVSLVFLVFIDKKPASNPSKYLCARMKYWEKIKQPYNNL
jgi:hypothetical protein